MHGSGVVKRILRDDNEGSRHQKFLLTLSKDRSILVAHNIDLAPRIPELKMADKIGFYGEYEWNEQGGVLHWTHDDPKRQHENGWLKHKGVIYR